MDLCKNSVALGQAFDYNSSCLWIIRLFLKGDIQT